MDTSVDGKIFFTMLEKIFDLSSAHYLKDNKTFEAEMLNDLRNYCKSGGELAYQLVPDKFVEEITEALEKNSIPYFKSPTPDGYMIMVRDIDANLFHDISAGIYQLSTDYVKECTASNILNITKDLKFDNVISLSFNDERMLEAAKQKLYQSNIVSAQIPGTNTLVISPNSLFNPKATSKDLTDFEIEHALVQLRADDPFSSHPEFMEIRLKQAAYDKKALDSFAKAFKEEKDVVLCSLKNPINPADDKKANKANPDKDLHTNYLLSKDGEIYYVDLDKKTGEWVQQKLDIDPSASIEEISTVCSKYANKLYNMSLVAESTFERELKGKVDSLSDETLIKYYKRPSLPVSCNSAYRYIESLRLAAIKCSKEATKMVKANPSYNEMSTFKKRALKKEYFASLMTSDCSLTKDFREQNKNVDPQIIDASIENFLKHFEDTEEHTPFSCDIKLEKVKSIEKQITQNYEKTHGMEQNINPEIIE